MMKKDTIRVGDIATTRKAYSFKGVIIRVTAVYEDGGVTGVVLKEGPAGTFIPPLGAGRGWRHFERLFGFNDYYNAVK